MISLISRLGSLRLTPWGLLLFAAGVLAILLGEVQPLWALLPGGMLLAFNLAAGLFIHPQLKQNPGLLVFHLGLLAVALLALVGHLKRFEARIELVEGGSYDPARLMALKAGPLHGEGWRHISFIQGPYSVDYDPGLERSHTRSILYLPDGKGGWRRMEAGDDQPLLIDGYRFYTTWNKGFAVILSWFPRQGGQATGAVHMPAYPGMEWKQENDWRIPGTEESLHLTLRLPPRPPEDKAWRLLGERRTDVPLQVDVGSNSYELRAGQSLDLPQGRLRYEEVRGWMGYKIYYDPTLPWMFWNALVAICGLGWHYLNASRRRQPDSVRMKRTVPATVSGEANGR